MIAFLRNSWWKYLSLAILAVVIAVGLTKEVPQKVVLYETIRNLFYHVPCWFAMLFLQILAVVHGIRYLNKGELKDDVIANQFVRVAILFGILGFATGTLWGKYTWGPIHVWLKNDPKILGALVSLMAFLAYLVLRGSLKNFEQRAKISAVYAIFVLVLYIAFAYVIPRMTDTAHPGSVDNPSFKFYEVSNQLRWVFYLGIIGWTLLGLWIASIAVRLQLLTLKKRGLDLESGQANTLDQL